MWKFLQQNYCFNVESLNKVFWLIIAMVTLCAMSSLCFVYQGPELLRKIHIKLYVDLQRLCIMSFEKFTEMHYK